MVNTFILNNPKTFKETAQKLDFKRLNKQILESFQILDTIENYELLSKFFDSPIPKETENEEQKEKLKKWTREIMRKYKSLDYYIFRHQGELVSYSKNNKELPKKLRYDEEYKVKENKTILYNNKIYKKYTLILPGDKFITQGYCYHPIVLMFMHYKDTLKLYINSCIEVFVERGGKKGVLSRKIDSFSCKEEDIVHPSWCLNPIFHENHKAALLYKELERGEKPWYINFPDFVAAYLKYYKSLEDLTPLSTTPAPFNKKATGFPFYMWEF